MQIGLLMLIHSFTCNAVLY